jgi:hypothetical protein
MQEVGQNTLSAQGLWLVNKRKYAILPVTLGKLDNKTEVLLKMKVSGISRGTEKLVFNAKVPESQYQRMRAPLQRGDFPFPVQYGYCAVADIIDGPSELIGKTTFCLHPHQDIFIVSIDKLSIVPEYIPVHRAVLAANMETALNAIWDSGVTAGDTVAIIGGGVLGLLLSFLVGRIPATRVTLIDPVDRSEYAAQFGTQFRQTAPEELNADVVFHTSASEGGLQTAFHCAGEEARIMEVSWHGDHLISLPLGGAFHSKRLQLISSQVGQITSDRRSRWNYARRLQTALELLADQRLDSLLTHQIPFEDAATKLPVLLDDPKALAISLTY